MVRIEVNSFSVETMQRVGGGTKKQYKVKEQKC